MNDDKYLRSVRELEQAGCKWWPKEVRDEAMKVSILQYLLDTQEEFISLLTLADNTTPEKLFKLLEASGFEYHLFLKHLILLTDVYSESLLRFNSSFWEIFPEGKLEFHIGKQKHIYKFTAMPTQGVLNNKKMQSDTFESLSAPCRNVELCKDLIMILIYGAASTTTLTAVLYKCNAYEYLGNQRMIRDVVKHNSYKKFWHDSKLDERGAISIWILHNVFALS